ncbi:MAG TPA: ion transporter [Longimicrobium sp.]
MPASAPTERLALYDLFTLGLSVYVLAALVASTLLPLDPESRKVLDTADNVICLVFLLDFFRNLIRADRKMEYLRWGWLDLVASIPTLDALRFARVARMVRVVRVLRGFRSARHLGAFILGTRAGAAFWGMALLTFLVLVFSSVAILHVERDAPGASIRTAADAVWWAYATVATVGYGDRVPVTTEGRIIAALLMTLGVGLFGTFTGYIAKSFLQPADSTDASVVRALELRVERLEGVASGLHD